MTKKKPEPKNLKSLIEKLLAAGIELNGASSPTDNPT